MHPPHTRLPPPRAEPRPGKSAAVSSLDCLSSIVERISTESPTQRPLLLADAPPESSPGPQEAAAGRQVGAAPRPFTTLPQGLAGTNPNPIYQVLWGVGRPHRGAPLPTGPGMLIAPEVPRAQKIALKCQPLSSQQRFKATLPEVGEAGAVVFPPPAPQGKDMVLPPTTPAPLPTQRSSLRPAVVATDVTPWARADP